MSVSLASFCCLLNHYVTLIYTKQLVKVLLAQIQLIHSAQWRHIIADNTTSRRAGVCHTAPRHCRPSQRVEGGIQMRVRGTGRLTELGQTSLTLTLVSVCTTFNTKKCLLFIQYICFVLQTHWILKSRISMAKAAFNKMKTFHQQTGLKFK